MKFENDYLSAAFAKSDQVRNQRRMAELREKEKKRKVDTRRYIIIGELVCKYFPSLMELQPQQDKESNTAEFSSLEAILRWLRDGTDLIHKNRNQK